MTSPELRRYLHRRIWDQPFSSLPRLGRRSMAFREGHKSDRCHHLQQDDTNDQDVLL